MSGFVCGTCGALTNIFGKEGVQTLASRTGVEVIGKIKKKRVRVIGELEQWSGVIGQLNKG